MLLCRTTGNHRKPTVTLLEGLPPMPLGKPRSREGPGMSDARFLSMNRPVRIDGKPVDDHDWRNVTSPFDGHVIARVPVCTAADVDRAVDAAAAALDDPLPAWRRAEILDQAARLLRERVDEFAATIAAEAAKPLKTARVEAERAVSTFTFAAVEARRLTGEMVPMDAADVGEGKLAFTLRVPVGVVGA